MTDNNLFFKVLAELSDTEYFTFLFFSTNEGGGGGGQALSGKFHYFFIFFETLPKPNQT